MKQTVNVSEKEYCYHVCVIAYALYTGKGKAVVKRTSEISKIVGVSKRTLQFYDDEEMIKVERSENNYRLYDEKTLGKLWEIMVYKEMGLKLEDIKQLLVRSENEKKGFYKAYIEQIEEKIKELERQERFISLIIAKGLPQRPDENSNVTYKSRLDMHRIGDGSDIGKGKAAVRRSDGIIENKYKRQKNKSDHPDQIRSCQKLFFEVRHRFLLPPRPRIPVCS